MQHNLAKMFFAFYHFVCVSEAIEGSSSSVTSPSSTDTTVKGSEVVSNSLSTFDDGDFASVLKFSLRNLKKPKLSYLPASCFSSNFCFLFDKHICI